MSGRTRPGAIRQTTMKDIAAAAHVSQSTVSRILSGADPAVQISDSTRARVLAYAQEFGYRPNPMARALRGAPTMLIGAIVRDITDPFFSIAVDALSLGARTHGYSVVLGHAREQFDEALALAAVLEARQCDAIVLLGDIRDQPILLEDLKTVDVPVIELWHGSVATEFPMIGVDNASGMRAVLRHLHELGHRHTALVGAPTKADVRERLVAYTEFMRGVGCEVPDGYVQNVVNTPAGGVAALDALTTHAERPTAVAAATDSLAFGILHRAFELGLTVPDDLSVTGFDDIPLSANAVPALTTLRMPIVEMATAAVELAIAGVKHCDGMPTVRVYPPELVVRRSTAPWDLSIRLKELTP